MILFIGIFKKIESAVKGEWPEKAGHPVKITIKIKLKLKIKIKIKIKCEIWGMDSLIKGFQVLRVQSNYHACG